MRYINTNASILWGKDELTKEYLIGVKERNDLLIDIKNETFFNTETNTWDKIKGDNQN
jgi:hypothetical protein